MPKQFNVEELEVIKLLTTTDLTGKEIERATGMNYQKINYMAKKFRSKEVRDHIASKAKSIAGTIGGSISKRNTNNAQVKIDIDNDLQNNLIELENKMVFRTIGNAESIRNKIDELKMMLDAIDGMSSNSNVTLIIKVNK